MNLEQFRTYERHNMTPKRLVENYVARINLTKDDAEIINNIIDYAVWLVTENYKQDELNPRL